MTAANDHDWCGILVPKAVRGAEMQKRSLADSRETGNCTPCNFAGMETTALFGEELRSKLAKLNVIVSGPRRSTKARDVDTS